MDMVILLCVNIFTILIGILGLFRPIISVFSILISIVVLFNCIVTGISDSMLLDLTVVSIIISAICFYAGYKGA